MDQTKILAFIQIIPEFKQIIPEFKQYLVNDIIRLIYEDLVFSHKIKYIFKESLSTYHIIIFIKISN